MEAAAVAFGAAYATGDLFCFLVAMLTMGLIMTGLTLVLAWALTRTAVAHLQIAAAVLLLIAALLWSTLPFSFSGTRSPVTALLFLLASYLIVPLAAILPGMVWFWPGERSCVLKATALCAAATFTVEVLLYLALSFVLPKDQIYSAVLWLLNTLAANPLAAPLLFLAVFALSAFIAVIMYHLLAIAGMLHPAPAVAPPNRNK